MGLALLDALEGREKAEYEAKYLTDRLWLANMSHATALDAYHRKWWLMVPLGLLAGVTLTITVQLALAR